MTPEYVQDIVGLALVAIFGLLVAIGILLNMFIVGVNLNCWKKSQPLQAVDIIITSLATMRIIILVLFPLFIAHLLSHESIFQMHIYPEYVIILTMSVEFCSLWWGSLLCVFYCVKITNYSNRLFMRLKMKISKMVPWLLLMSLVPSALSTLPCKWFILAIHSFNGTDDQTAAIKSNLINSFMIRFAGSIIPFIIFSILVGLLIVSLLKHIRHMGSGGSGFSDAQRDIHLSVIRNMISFLLFYALYFLSSNLLPACIIFKNNLLLLLCSICYVAFPSLHSISIIVSNRDLKNAILSIFCCSWVKLLADRS